jgi:RNA polymerase sigma-70 factor, ECF subfamily
MNELPVLYRVAHRFAGNSQDAEDLVATTLLRVAKSWESFDGRHPRSWMLTILRNEFLSAHRSKASRVQTVELDENLTMNSDIIEEIDNQALVNQLTEALNHLPAEFAWAVTLCDVEGLSYQEAADVMKVPTGTVKSRVHRGRGLLRERVMGAEGQALKMTEATI